MSRVTQSRAVLRTAAPLVSVGAAWAVRRAMVAVYESRTGKPAPLVASHERSVVAKVLWAASVAALVALIEGLVIAALGEEEESRAAGV